MVPDATHRHHEESLEHCKLLEEARQLHVIEVTCVENWRLLAAMLPMRSLNRCPASIREVPMANVGHLSRTVIDSPSLVQPSACLRNPEWQLRQL